MKISQYQSARPRALSWLVAFVSFATLLTGGTAVAGTKKHTEAFPAVGHEYQLDFGDDLAFVIAFKSDHVMTFTRLKEPQKGAAQTVQFKHEQIRDGVYMVYWQEADKTTVVHVEDFAKGIIYSNITTPNGSFYNRSSKLIELKSAVKARPLNTAIPAAAALKVETYNPGKNGIFAVSSTLVTGANDAVLIDAQFSAADARKLGDLVKKSGKRLTTIYISHGDPDYYFGLDTLTATFPTAKILATPQTIAHIKATQADKLKVWVPQLGENAPKRIVIPDPLQGSEIDLEGNKLKVVGLDGPTPDRSLVWIASIKTIAGGIPVVAGEHVWMADTQTPKSHADWLATLELIAALKPEVVIPGHFSPGAAQNLDAVRFTSEYIKTYDAESAKAKNSGELVAAMKARYPNLGGLPSLELSAKVTKREMEWH